MFFLKRPAPGHWSRLIAVALCIGVLHFGLSSAHSSCRRPVLARDRDAELRADDRIVGVVALGERFAWRTGMAIAVSFGGVLVLGFDPRCSTSRCRCC
jgi:O-acetylserine/cysteine efflux transporter